MKNRSLIFTLLTLFTMQIMNTHAQSTLEVAKDLSKAIDKCADCFEVMNTFKIKNLRTEIKEIKKTDWFRDKSELAEQEAFVRDLLKIQIYQTDVKVMLAILQNKYVSKSDGSITLAWYERGKLAQLIRNTGKMLILQSHYQQESEVLGRISELEQKQLRVLRTITNNNIEGIEDGILDFLKNQISSTRFKSEGFVFDVMVPDTTMKQMETFIDFGKYDYEGEIIFNQFSLEVFEMYFEQFTYDGEYLTVNSFKEFVNQKESFKRSLWLVLFNDNTFQKNYKSSQTLSQEFSKKLNNGKELDGKEYEEILINSVPKETAYTALLKIIAPYLKDEEYKKAYSLTLRYEIYFSTGGILYERLRKKYYQLLEDLESKSSSEIYVTTYPVVGINSNDDEIRFLLHRNQKKVAIVPHKQYSHPRFYERESHEKWRELQPSKNRVEYGNTYWFEDSNLKGRDNLEKIGKTKTFKLVDFKSEVVYTKDFYIDYRKGVAFFVSNSNYQRKAAEDSDDYSSSTEYESPWYIHSSLKLQEEKLKSGYHGKEYGNTNTDIYFSTYNNKKKTWRKPKILPKVNTPFSERSPFLSEDGGTLYFSSEGHSTFGGFDIFKIDISIIHKNSKTSIVEPSGEVTNHFMYNSYFDELYYMEVGDQKYLSKNENFEDFDICYTVISEKTPERLEPFINEEASKIIPKVNEVPDFDFDNDKFIENGGGAVLVADCRTSTKKKTVPEGKIFVTGTILDSKGRMLKKATLTFTNSIGEQKEIEIGSGNNIYQIVLDDDQTYNVQVFGITQEGNVVEEYTESLIDVCKNRNGMNYVRFDVKTESLETLMANDVEMKAPFFFKTNGTGAEIINLVMISSYYIQSINKFKANKDVKFALIGYADKRASDEYNCDLAARRCQTVFSFFVNLGFNSKQLIKIPMGETLDFSKENFSFFGKYLNSGELEEMQHVQLKEYQLNRRVQIIFTNKTKKDFRICLE